MRGVTLILGLGVVLAACKGDDKTDGTDGEVVGDDTASAITDADGDGYGSAAEGGTDCDDGNATIHPDAEEFCDGVDNDCDSEIDEGVLTTWYSDTDGDGYGADATGADACASPGAGWVATPGDCDDGDDTVHPNAQELCDGVDQDCDGSLDNGVTTPFFRDADLDGYGDPASVLEACSLPEGYVESNLDCDDTNPLINPDADELCDGVDDDCDGSIDEEDAVDAVTFYRDDDGDGYGDPDFFFVACVGLSGYVDNDLDCEDTMDQVNPDAVEICGDELDNDCDGTPNGCMPYGDLSLSSADAIFRGADAGDRAGQGDPGIAGAGDLNGDGFGDIIIGAVKEGTVDTNAGAAYIVFGPVSGEMSLSAADGVRYGESAASFAGRAVAGVGDLNMDGYDDVVVGAQGDKTMGSNTGAAYVVYGPISGSDNLSNADAKLTGEAAGDLVADVAWVGDATGDGIPDVLIGAQFNDEAANNAGIAYLVAGPISTGGDLSSATARLLGEAEDDEAGNAVWGAGDVNADGYADLLVGARTADHGGEDAGAAYLVLAPVTGTQNLSAAYAIYTGEDAGDELGYGVSVSTAGDVNNDGYVDIILGARKHTATEDNQGAAYLVLGPATGGIQDVGVAAVAKFVGEASKDYTGDSVSGPGDVNGDGTDDLLIGSGYADAGASNGGVIYLEFGPVSGTVSLADASARLMAEGDEDRARAHAAGDIDNDGFMDILVGAQNNDTAGTEAGAAYLFLGGSW